MWRSSGASRYSGTTAGDSAVSLLCMLEVGSNIPPELYQVVAAIYCQLLKTSYKLKNGHDPLPKGNGASGLPGGF